MAQEYEERIEDFLRRIFKDNKTVEHIMEIRGGYGNKNLLRNHLPTQKSRYDLSKVNDPKLREHLMMHEKLDREYFRNRPGWENHYYRYH